MSLQKIATAWAQGPTVKMCMAFVLVGSVAITACGGGSTSATPPPPITAADFALSVSPATVTQQAGEVGTPVSVAVSGLHGFSGSVNVLLSGLPPEIASTPASPFTIAVNATQNVTFTIPASATVGDSDITLSGVSGSLSHSTPLKLTVTPSKDFTLSVSSVRIAATIGDTSPAFAVSVTGVNGFSDNVSVAIAGLPAGTTTQPPSPFNVAAGSSQNVTVSAPMATALGNFNLVVTGTNGGLSPHNTALTLTVLPVIKTYETADMLYLETDTSTETTKIGLKKAWGASIAEVSWNGTNYVNTDDPGREIQTSLWDGNLNYAGGIGPWNPVEAGDSSFNGSPVLVQQLGVDNIYTTEMLPGPTPPSPMQPCKAIAVSTAKVPSNGPPLSTAPTQELRFTSLANCPPPRAGLRDS